MQFNYIVHPSKDDVLEYSLRDDVVAGRWILDPHSLSDSQEGG